MRPAFRLEFNGVDVTERVRDRLLSLRVIDESGSTSDRLEFRIDDRDFAVPAPAQGASVRVWLGYTGGGRAPAYMGRYTVDEVELAGPPAAMTVRARAADLVKTYRKPKTRSWDSTTVADVVERIAVEHGFRPRVGDGLGGIAIAHADQTEESDAAFLTRIAEDNDAVAKPADGYLLFVRQDEGKTASGADAPAAVLGPSDLTRWRVTVAERGAYKAVSAFYQDHEGGKRVSVTEGEGEPVFQLRSPYQSEAEARRKARARLESFTRGRSTFEGGGPGDPELFAERPLRLSGFRPLVDGEWSLKRVEHSLDSAGYTTRLSAQIKGD